MSGHSKWHNIMHKKGKTDAQRAKVFTKIGRDIASLPFLCYNGVAISMQKKKKIDMSILLKEYLIYFEYTITKGIIKGDIYTSGQGGTQETNTQFYVGGTADNTTNSQILDKNDKILTLSTCYNDNDKIVLHAKLIKQQIK